MKTSILVKIVVNEFNMSKDEIIGGVLIGMSSVFFPEVINNTKFRDYIIGEISKNNACRNHIDEYLKTLI